MSRARSAEEGSDRRCGSPACQPPAVPAKRSISRQRAPSAAFHRYQRRQTQSNPQGDLPESDSGSESESDFEETIEEKEEEEEEEEEEGAPPPPAAIAPPSSSTPAPSSALPATQPPKSTPPTPSSHRGLVPVPIESQSTPSTLQTVTKSTPPPAASNPPPKTTTTTTTTTTPNPAKATPLPAQQAPPEKPSSSSSTSSPVRLPASTTPTTTTTTTTPIAVVLPSDPIITPIPEADAIIATGVNPLPFTTVSNFEEIINATETPIEVEAAPAIEENSMVNASIGVGTVSGLAAVLGFVMILSRAYKRRSQFRSGSSSSSSRGTPNLPTAKTGPLPGTFEPFKPIMLPPGMSFTIVPASPPPVPRDPTPPPPAPAMVSQQNYDMNMNINMGVGMPGNVSPEQPFVVPQEPNYGMGQPQMPQRASSMYPDGANMYPPPPPSSTMPPMPNQMQQMGPPYYPPYAQGQQF